MPFTPSGLSMMVRAWLRKKGMCVRVVSLCGGVNMEEPKLVNAVIFSVIGGFNVGIEWLWDWDMLVVDLGILRITFCKMEEGDEDE
jgi:hypothetical protein